MPRVARPLLTFLELFTIVGALVGTWGLAQGGMGMGDQVRRASPFTTWDQAALALFLVNAVTPAVVLVAALGRARWATWAQLVYGLVLIGWIAGQVAFVGYISLLQPLMAGVGMQIGRAHV